jgi:Leucine Rich repeat
MANASTIDAIDDPIEVEYLRARRLSRRRQLVMILASLALTMGYVGWKVGSHLIATYWFRAHHYRVLWTFDRENPSRVGSTAVKACVEDNLFGNAHLNDALKCLGWFHRVESLDLTLAEGVRDADLAPLALLTDMESLNLDRSHQRTTYGDAAKLTDATMTLIHPLVRLRELNLGGHAITDQGLANLSDLDRLQSLDLRQTNVTDAGLEHLKRLPRLKSVDLTGTKVTPKGVRDFEAQLPGVVVLADPPPSAAR